MLSIAPIGAGEVASGYAEYQESEVSRQGREDYYAGEQDAGRWAGQLASALGLQGDLQQGELLRMLQGYHPRTGEALAYNAGDQHKAGWDLTFSAPKSVSSVWAVANEDTRAAIERAQEAAAIAALKFLEERAFTSRDRQNPSPITSVLAARYQHGTSREKEPQLHTHCPVANMGLRADGSVCAIDFDARWKMAAGALYRSVLAAEMQKLGFATERDGDSFRLAGLPDALLQSWSTRAGQIRQALAEFGHATAKAAAVAARATRRGKEDSTQSELRAEWAATAAEHGVTAESIEALRSAEVAAEAQARAAKTAVAAAARQAQSQAQSCADAARIQAHATAPEHEPGPRLGEHATAGMVAAMEKIIAAGATRGDKIDPVKPLNPSAPKAEQKFDFRQVREWLNKNSKKKLNLREDEVAAAQDVPADQPAPVRAPDPVVAPADMPGIDLDALLGDLSDPANPLSPDAIFRAITEHDSVFTEHRIYQSVAVAAQGVLDDEGIRAYVARLMIQRELLPLRRPPELADCDARDPRATERHYTTRQMWLLETALAERAQRMDADNSVAVDVPAVDAAIAAFEARKGFALAPEQRAALMHVTSDTGALAIVRGAAGAGKTTMLEAAADAWRGAGSRVLGCALAGKATAGMAEVGIDSMTIAARQFLPVSIASARERRDQSADWLAKQVDIRDRLATRLESARKPETIERMQKSLEAAEQRVVAAADLLADATTALEKLEAQQLRAGDVLVCDEAGMVGSRDMSWLAQQCADAGAKLVLVGDEKQLQAISAGGAFRMLQRAVGRYAELVENRRQRSEDDRLAANAIVAGEAGEAIRNYLERGLVRVDRTRDESVAALVNGWLDDEIDPAAKLILTKTRADAAELNSLIQSHRFAGGEVINSVPLSTAAGKLAVGEGDRLLFGQNSKRLGVMNGQLGTVDRIDLTELGHVVTVRTDAGVSVRFLVGDPDDRDLAKNARESGLAGVYNNFALGYAITTHKSQGATVRASYVFGLGDREMGYVQSTRHKDRAHFYFTAADLEQLEVEAGNGEATARMLKAMEAIAKKQRLEPVPDNQRSFRTVREWLDLHSDVALGTGRTPDPKLEGLTKEQQELLLRLKDATRALAASHQKETTADYLLEAQFDRQAAEKEAAEKLLLVDDRAAVENEVLSANGRHDEVQKTAPADELALTLGGD
ncbi:MobF family relaxase [Rhodocyclus tenuis]|uniref:Conjugative relaxase-like TrwC/TraI family protein n=1 Tax=Rhodocyclus tenuis TaxID=1066 RepID=A0A840GIF0_RHOTE|nr:MobF family relaxase [Rhodocyclus tenuis]MBB4247959.1 conjugative relaxase-like TrwC/TraI family protein [Rhodocyclus tenuis]